MEKLPVLPMQEARPMHANEFAMYDIDLNETPSRIRRVNATAEAAMRTSLGKYIHSSLETIGTRSIEQPSDAEMIVATATEYVERMIGIRPDCPVYWTGGLDDITADGTYNSTEGVVQMVEAPYQSDFIRYIDLCSLAIHEKTHETGIATRKGYAVRMLKDGEMIGRRVLTVTGPLKNKVNNHSAEELCGGVGHFFEEAFAEETAARWREEVITDLPSRIDRISEKDFDKRMPGRYLHIPAEHISLSVPILPKVAAPSIAAYSMDLLSDISGVDFYDVMVKSRHPETEVEAKRTLVQSLNNVQPGLYRYLRDLPYSRKGFYEGLQLIRQVADK